MRKRVKAALLGSDSYLARQAAIPFIRRHYNIGNKLTNPELALYRQLGVEFGGLEFQKYLQAGLLSAPPRDIIDSAWAYQKSTLGHTLDPVLHIAYHRMFGAEEVRLLPRSFCWYHLIPFLNDLDYISAYSDKNTYTRIMRQANQPGTVLKNINGNYFDADDKPMARTSVPAYLAQTVQDAIIKPSRTDNGLKIASLKQIDNDLRLNGESADWREIEADYDSDFIIQRKISQHPTLSEPHPESVNTLRILTLRWEGELHFLLAFARFGSAGSVNDNAGTGGVCVGIDDAGCLMNYAVNSSAHRLEKHPTTHYEFAITRPIPAFSKAKQLCLDMHREILHHNLVSWDIAIDINEQPVFIENNFKGALWLYQLATGKPVLNTFSDSILTAMRRGHRHKR